MSAHERRGAVERGAAVRALSTAAVFLCAWLHCDHLSATERARVALELEGTPDCRDIVLLRQEVERRSDAVSWSRGDDAEVRVDVRISTPAVGYEARVVIQSANRPETRRSIAGGTCAEVVEGAALIIAVSLQPERRSPPPPPPEEPALPAPPRNNDERHWRFGGGTHGVLIAGVAPGALPGLEVFGDARQDNAGFAAAIRLGFRHVARSGFETPPGRTAFRADGALLAVCPLRLPVWGPLKVRPCALGTAGWLEASGSGIRVGRSDRHPWVTVGAALRLEVELLRPLALELEGSSELALTPGRFRIENAVVHETSSWGTRGAVGIAARF